MRRGSSRSQSARLRHTEQALACARVGIGLALLLSPARALRLWLGLENVPSRLELARAVGLRDVTLGCTLAAAARRDKPRRDLYAGASLVDLFDGALACLVLPRAGAPTAAIAAGAGLMGMLNWIFAARAP